MLATLRKVKRECPEKVSGVGTREGKVYAWLKPPNPSAPSSKIFFKTMTDIGKLCENLKLNFSAVSEPVTAN